MHQLIPQLIIKLIILKFLLDVLSISEDILYIC